MCIRGKSSQNSKIAKMSCEGSPTEYEARRRWRSDSVYPARFDGQRQRIQLATRTERDFPDVHAPLLAKARGARRTWKHPPLRRVKSNDVSAEPRGSRPVLQIGLDFLFREQPSANPATHRDGSYRLHPCNFVPSCRATII